MSISARPALSKSDEDNLQARLQMHVYAARRGNPWAAYEAAKCMAQLGLFDGPAASRRRSVFAQHMTGVPPDVSSQGWAEYVLIRGRR